MTSVKEKISKIKKRLKIPVFSAPMFLVSGPELVIAACNAGVIGAFPTLNARPNQALRVWLEQISKSISPKAAPWAANLIVHHSNKIFSEDLALIIEFKPEIVITSLGSPEKAVPDIHSYGGLIFADVNSVEFARKASERGADGLVLVCEGAGGHTGFMPAKQFIAEVREFFGGPLAIGGAISTGEDIVNAIKAGGDFAYMGTRFIATNESLASINYKKMIVNCCANDILLTEYFTGVPAHFLKPSIIDSGIDLQVLNQPRKSIDFNYLGDHGSAWKDIWSAGKGVGQINSVKSTERVVHDLINQYKNYEGTNSLR
ncbi:MAG: nitronate monooxygenase [Pseudomonadota bacterium]|nr:nitronate monooxygenase [Pseudomonadota bacterium]